MRIVIDVQGFQASESSLRGIGRYSIALTRTLITTYPENEYILFANASLKDIRDDFQNELTDNDLKVSYFQWFSITPYNTNLIRKYAVQLRNYALSIINADCILITSFFEGFIDNALTDIDTSYKLPPTFSIIYDLIPFINSDSYLDSNPLFKEFYYKKLYELENLDCLLAISKSSFDEAVKFLNFDSKFIFNISSGCDKSLFNTAANSSNLDKSIIKFGKFFLYSGAGDPRKNIEGLIRAYSNLSIKIQREYKLILVGKLFESEIDLIKKCITQVQLDKNQVIILGYVQDEYLVELYRNCQLFIFPSMHEGFGLPVLEAMCCGAPVITSNTSSLPEIVDFPEAMFNPSDIHSITTLIDKAVSNKLFYERLLENSKIRSKLFSWEITSRNLISNISNLLTLKCKKNYDSSLRTNSYNIFLNNLKATENEFRTDRHKSESLQKQLSSAIALINSQAYDYKQSFLDFQSNYSWRIEGPFDSNYSLAILNRNFALAMQSIGVNVCLHSTEGPGDYKPDMFFLRNHIDILDIYSRKVNCSEIVSRNLYPPRVHDLNSRLNILHSYGWEETEFPHEWVEDFNQYLDGITVMSKLVKNILINNGVFIPIKVAGLGIDHISKVNADSLFELDTKNFKFLHISSCFPRKGIDLLLTAYGQAFDKSDEVSLIIKTNRNPHNNVRQILRDLKFDNPDYPEVLILDDDLDDTKIKALYLLADVLVAPSLGEGFGLPIGEAMSLGLPVITTDWGGQLDFCNTTNAWLIDYKFVFSNSHFNLTSSVWAEPSINHLADLMLKLFNCSDSELQIKICNARNTIKQFTWKQVAQSNLEFSKSISNIRLAKKPRIGWITTFNSRCGIASYSAHLIEFISDHVTIFAPNEKAEVNDKLNICRCWDLDNGINQDLDQLFQQIIDKKISTIVIQFNYGFFDFDKLASLIKKLSSKKINIIIFMHSTLDPVNHRTKSLIYIKKELRLCNRILVHSPNDLNRLKDYELVENVSLFPHGILDFNSLHQLNKPRFNVSKTQLVKKVINIATYGFCLPNKGYKQLIESIALLQNDSYSVDLTIFSAIHSSSESLKYFSELKLLIKQFKLDSYIKLDSHYYSDEETILNLSKQDLIIFPYQESNESSSASIRHGLAAGPPVLATPVSIFNDLNNIIFILPGISPKLIAKGIDDWITNRSNQKDNDSKINTNYMNWKAQHRFSLLGRRLEGLIRALEIEDRF
tara:strand:+ start:1952 stop:5596 length:3645 start_codon:yes stop_codon:yes gene_type:complete